MPVLEFDDNGLLERIATSRLRISPLTRIRLWQRYRWGTIHPVSALKATDEFRFCMTEWSMNSCMEELGCTHGTQRYKTRLAIPVWMRTQLYMESWAGKDPAWINRVNFASWQELAVQCAAHRWKAIYISPYTAPSYGNAQSAWILLLHDFGFVRAQTLLLMSYS
jgi:hypothetical protein